MDAMGIDYNVLFPSPLLMLGQHPLAEIEVAIARAYNRWLVEKVLVAEKRIMSLLYLPFNDPEASLKVVEDFGDKPGVRGFMVTAVHFKPVHDKAYMKLYRALEERGLALAFHASYLWDTETSVRQMNRFLSVHALTFPYYLMMHLTNWIVNGLPELFPKLRVAWIEGGIAFLPFLMMRLDHEYLMRISEAPLLKRLPSDYMREMYYTSQPLETPPKSRHMIEPIFKMINADTQMMFASDYPHWDFDVPGQIFDLPFLDDHAKRNILGLNACRFLGVDPATLPLVKPKIA
jgi:predicted TIM-barrel fold metal-dependent hydrolase